MKRLMLKGWAPSACRHVAAALGLMAVSILTPAVVRAQPASPGTQSGLPADTSKPAFDTATPVYDQGDPAAKAAQTVVAEIDGRPITLGDVGDAIRQIPASLTPPSFDSLYPVVLQQLIQRQALVIRAQRQGVDDDPAVKRRARAASDQVIAQELLRREIGAQITEKALLDRYRATVAGRPGPEEVHVRVILVGTEQEALDILAELRAGGDFGAIARRSSKDPTATKGGDLGFLRRDGLNPEVGAVAFALPPGQVVPNPVRSSGAWFVVRIDERRRGATPSFAVTRGLLYQEMLNEGVAGVMKAAMESVKIREYTITGKEIEADKP